jgi:hypothetical protein
MLALYRLLEQYGETALGEAMAIAAAGGAYGAEYLTAILTPTPVFAWPAAVRLPLPGVPQQVELDRLLSSYEVCVQVEATTAQPV